MKESGGTRGAEREGKLKAMGREREGKINMRWGREKRGERTCYLSFEVASNFVYSPLSHLLLLFVCPPFIFAAFVSPPHFFQFTLLFAVARWAHCFAQYTRKSLNMKNFCNWLVVQLSIDIHNKARSDKGFEFCDFSQLGLDLIAHSIFSKL